MYPQLAATVQILILPLAMFPSDTRTPRDYADWLVEASEIDFVFLKGAYQYDFFFAVYSAGANEVAFCYRDLSVELGRSESRLLIVDEKGNSLIDLGGKQRVLKRAFERHSRIGPANISTKHVEIYGRVYPLKQRGSARLRVVFEVKSAQDDAFRRVFDERVHNSALKTDD